MRFRVKEEHKEDCGHCYGNGCAMCHGRGWIETQEGREERESAEEDWADAERERQAEERMERDEYPPPSIGG